MLEASYRDKNAAPEGQPQTDTTASGATTTPAQTTPNINTSTGAVDEGQGAGDRSGTRRGQGGGRHHHQVQAGL